MRITRAYTITPEVKRILDKKPNKSDFVCRAVTKLHNGGLEYALSDVSTLALLAALQGRTERGSTERDLIQTLIKIYNK